MKGLLIKDMELTLANKRTIPIFVIIMVMLLVTGDESMTEFAVSFLTMVCGILVISSISYDEFEHGTSYLLTLPVSRKIYVVEKYVFMLLSMLAGCIFSMAVTLVSIQMKGYQLDMMKWFGGCVATFMVLLVMISIMIPIQLKFGGENGRIVMIAFLAVIFVIVFGGAKIAEWIGLDIEKIATETMRVVSGVSENTLVAIGAFVVVVTVAVTIAISNHIMKKKEF